MVLFLVKFSLTHFWIVSIDAPLYGFLVVIMSCLLAYLTPAFYCEIYSLM